MTHAEFYYVLLRLQDVIDEYLEQDTKFKLTKKEFNFLLNAFCNAIFSDNGVIRSKDYPNANSLFKRLVEAGLFFKISEKDGFVCSVASQGILYVNSFFFFIDEDFTAINNGMKINKDFLRRHYLSRGDYKQRLVNERKSDSLQEKINKK